VPGNSGPRKGVHRPTPQEQMRLSRIWRSKLAMLLDRPAYRPLMRPMKADEHQQTGKPVEDRQIPRFKLFRGNRVCGKFDLIRSAPRFTWAGRPPGRELTARLELQWCAVPGNFE